MSSTTIRLPIELNSQETGFIEEYGLHFEETYGIPRIECGFVFLSAMSDLKKTKTKEFLAPAV